jgi:hypothetical protein
MVAHPLSSRMDPHLTPLACAQLQEHPSLIAGHRGALAVGRTPLCPCTLLPHRRPTPSVSPPSLLPTGVPPLHDAHAADHAALEPPVSTSRSRHRRAHAGNYHDMGARRGDQREQAKPLRPWAVAQAGRCIPALWPLGQKPAHRPLKHFPFPLICFNIHRKWVELLKNHGK